LHSGWNQKSVQNCWLTEATQGVGDMDQSLLWLQQGQRSLMDLFLQWCWLQWCGLLRCSQQEWCHLSLSMTTAMRGYIYHATTKVKRPRVFTKGSIMEDGQQRYKSNASEIFTLVSTLGPPGHLVWDPAHCAYCKSCAGKHCISLAQACPTTFCILQPMGRVWTTQSWWLEEVSVSLSVCRYLVVKSKAKLQNTIYVNLTYTH